LLVVEFTSLFVKLAHNRRKIESTLVHQATISVVILDSAGKLMMEAILETKTATILQFIHGLRGSLHVTLEDPS
jgi:hypothetical protein